MNRRFFAWGLLLCGTCLTPALHAQSVTVTPSPERYRIDARNVDRITDTVLFQTTDLQMGPAGPGGLALVSFNGRGGPGGALPYSGGTNWESMRITANGSAYQASDGFTSALFTRSGNTFTPVQSNGYQLSLSGSTYVLTAADGTKIEYGSPTTSNETNVVARAARITYPTGEVTTLTWRKVSFCYGVAPNAVKSGGGTTSSTTPAATPNASCNPPQERVRLDAVANSQGYGLNYYYMADDTPYDQQSATSWQTLYAVTGINNASGDCYPSGGVCSTNPPTVSYAQSGNMFTVTDALNRSTRYTVSGTGLSIKTPISSSDDIIYTFASGGVVSQVQWRGLTYTYANSVAGNVRTVAVTDPLNHVQTTTADTNIAQILTSQDGLTHTTTYAYDSGGNLTSVTTPRGLKIGYTLDARGNVMQTDYYPVGSDTSGFHTSATYPTSCTYPVSCNKPTSVTDANSHTTTMHYNDVHGGLDYATGPAVNSVQPQVRYTYSQLQAYYKNSSGTLVASGVPVWRLTQTSQCRTTANCTGTADETRSTIAYGTTGAPNNLLPTSVSTGAGDGSLTATSTLAYDAAGDLLTVDGPLSGSADMVRYRYDADREQVGVIGPDPDGGGPLKNRAQRLTYAADGQETLAEVGTVASQSDGDWSGFTSLQQAATAYDTVGRVVLQSVAAGGGTYGAVQYSYDAAGRPTCTAVRMNTAAYTGLPDACTQSTRGTPDYGPDRITRNVYDESDRLTSVMTGVGGTSPYTVASYGYDVDNDQTSLIDAKGNRTTYQYDGFDRLTQRFYPDPANVGTSSTTDYEGYSYNGDGTLLVKRLRNGSGIIYNYDGLSRLTSKTLPSGTTNLNPTYGYDLVGNLLSATSTNGTHSTSATFTYDALGRQVSQASSFDSVAAPGRTLQYDLAGRRTRLTWSDGFYVTYDYDAADEMTTIRENGGTALATFGYDDLGRRTSRSLANGTSTSYGYDAVSRLTGLGLNGGTNATAVTFSGYNPAGQIGSRSNSNDAYAWGGGVNVNRAYTSNGQNRYATIAGSTQSYDAKGNLSGSFGATYSYDAENELASGNGYTFYHDAIGRLSYVTSTGLFGYDGSRQVEQASASGVIVRRYVFGPGTDEPIVWYEGLGTSDKRYLDADERGSITRITRQDGSTLAINTYDEYGIPGSGNQGRFQYTGQTWLSEVGFYDYKARAYSGTMGRFMQPDPIAEQGGINFYNYVHADPVNLKDPLGLQDAGIVDCTDSVIASEDPRCVVEVKGRRGSGSNFGGGGSISTGVGGIPLGGGGGGGANPFRQLLRKIKNAVVSTYCTLAPRPAATLEASVTSSAVGFKGGFTFGYTVAVDNTGSLEVFQTDGAYKGYGAGLGLSVTGGASTAKKVDDLSGLFVTGIITAAEAGGGTATVFSGNSSDGPVLGGEVGIDVGVQDSVLIGGSNSKPVLKVNCAAPKG